MREYDSAGIRNIAVVGHGGSGKTSLVDALCFAAGSGRRHGTVRDGTALTDHLPEEIERGYSIALGCAYAEWMEAKINFIDTPGSLDFQGEALAGLELADFDRVDEQIKARAEDRSGSGKGKRGSRGVRIVAVG